MSQSAKNAPGIAVIIGTRAQFIKTAPVMLALDKRRVPYRFIFAGQHRETIDAIRENFGVRPPDYTLSTGSFEAKTISLFSSWLCRAIWALIVRRHEIIPFRGGIVINHGDTATCLWGTLLARLTGNKAMHLESGLRSFRIFKPFPEEVIRLLTFGLTNVYVCPNEWALGNLKHYHGVKLNTGLNTLYDAVQLALESDDAAESRVLPSGPFAVVSIHRFEHIFNPAVFARILDVVEQAAVSMKLVFVEHPATARQLDKLGLRQRLAVNANITVCGRLPFFDFIKLIARSEYVITDGGSNQEELSYLGKPTLVLREATERREGLGENALLSKFDPELICGFLANYNQYRRGTLQIAHKPSEVIVDWLVSNGFPAAADDHQVKGVSALRIVSAMLLLLLVAGYVWIYRDVLLAHVANFEFGFAPWLMLIAFASIVINGLIMSGLVSQFGVKLHMWESIGLAATGSLGNYLPVPQAGAVVRGLYLKKVHQLPYNAFTATVLVTYVMMLPAIGVLGLLGLAMIPFNGGVSLWPLWCLFGGMAASVAVFGPAMGVLRPFKLFSRFREGVDILLKHHILWRMAILQVAQLILTAIVLCVSFMALGRPIEWQAGLILGLFSNCAGIFNITVGNLGVTESATALGAYFLGGDRHLAVVAYSVYRLASIAVLIIVSALFMLLWRKKNGK